MNTLKISTRLMLLIGVLAAVLIGIGSMGLYGMAATQESLKATYENRTIPAAQLGQIQALVLHNRVAINAALVTPTPEVLKASSEHVDTNAAAITKLWEAYMATELTPEEARLAKAFAEDRKAFLNEGILPALAALRANDMKEAQHLLTTKIRSVGATMEKGGDALVQLQIDEAKKAFEASAARYATTRTVAILAILGGLSFAVLFGLMLARSIGRQLGGEPAEAAALARSVAEGDLTTHIQLKNGDTTSLMAQLSTMQASLAKVVSNVRQNSEGVATASSQIAQGNQDLSQRTEEQASALEETAASMEQLGSTVRQNADNAKQANQLAMGASTVAIKGGEVVGQVVETMKGINDASKKISDIIGVIDGIAFQTNILALNAAVEAARAGEQGRGFAVVASEVRSLAQRSAEAAKEIKNLINASVERVEQGSALVDQAGVTMSEVVSAIKRVTDIMGEISSASTEQSAGVAQVGEAVTQMDQATQQNAALVEESAAAAESLKVQAQQLVQAVAVFRLTAGGSPVQGHAVALPTKASATVDRRGPNRAKNVSRLSPKPAVKRAPAASAEPMVARKTGTDDEWTTF
ncbi:MAG: methyl-accepting chemotaxis protein [Burkholderiales bacterium]